MGLFSNLKNGAFVTRCKMAGIKHGMTESEAERIGDEYFETLVRIGNSTATTYKKIAPWPEWAMCAVCLSVLENSTVLTPEHKFRPVNTYAMSFIQSYPSETFLVDELKKARLKATSYPTP